MQKSLGKTRFLLARLPANMHRMQAKHAYRIQGETAK